MESINSSVILLSKIFVDGLTKFQFIDSWKYESGVCKYDDSEYWQPPGTDIMISFKEHGWGSSLNRIAYKIYKKTGKSPDKLKLNLATFLLIGMEYHDYYQNKKLAHYTIDIDDHVVDNKIIVI